MDRARRWLAPVRAALGPDFVAAYLTGSVLTEGFDPKHSQINVLVVARAPCRGPGSTPWRGPCRRSAGSR